ncbi:MAG: 3-methyl-2-oxobutanoate dehydrogenase subunit VorB [Spirochaetales bacterium]|nr:3-methyl-2-oxobutanoate dehydrogenase subunit VorB [Spirochaetales bacterium]MCF7938438.1 3-methyl-2-oxobutanoate dehydrogenase subunit VorB [Spirochaetales bacterium]
MKGNDAVVYGALLGGATHFFGYPITPASEIAHAAALHFTRTGRTFLQAENEENAINMIYGAASAGARVMSASSGPGISLMSEGISYMAGSELPCVLVDIQRAGPGLGNIWPEQSDYIMVAKGGAHGNYHNIVLAPNSAQEMCDLTYRAFELAERYRMPTFILADAYIGQMMEPVELPSEPKTTPRHDWAVYGDSESRGNLITSIMMNTDLLSEHNWKLLDKAHQVEKNELEFEELETHDAEVLLIAFGISSRISHTAVEILRSQGIKAGLLRPITLFPFPYQRIKELSEQVDFIAAVELNEGQMAEDIERAVAGKTQVLRYNWLGGIIPSTEEIVERITTDMGSK